MLILEGEPPTEGLLVSASGNGIESLSDEGFFFLS